MKINEYQIEELNKARQLQRELQHLHIPVPILSWEYKVFDKDDKLVETGIGKSNSYTRNALNALAYYVGQVSMASVSAAYIDGGISFKNISGSVYAPNYYSAYPERCGMRNNRDEPIIRLGSNNAAESLDTHTITNIGTQNATQIITSWDSVDRILTTVLVHVVSNETASTISICEAGVYQKGNLATYTTYEWFMMVRDVFEPIEVPPYNRIQWSYVFEVSYPEP